MLVTFGGYGKGCGMFLFATWLAYQISLEGKKVVFDLGKFLEVREDEVKG